jgi:hypothetical protein
VTKWLDSAIFPTTTANTNPRANGDTTCTARKVRARAPDNANANAVTCGRRSTARSVAATR